MAAPRVFGKAHRFGSRLGAFGPCALLLLASAVACEKKPPEPSAQPASPFLPAQPSAAPAPLAPTPAPAASMQQEPLHITWIDPPAFKRVPPSNAMRKAAFVV